MSVKGIATIAVAIVFIIISITLFNGCIGKNELSTYQIKQSIAGAVDVIDDPGIYNRAFGTVHTYQRSVQAFYSASKKEGTNEDESIGVHFNDGGTAQISVMVQFQMPTDAEKRKHLHQTFGGIEGVKLAVRAHLINCVKNTGPMMSATENQAARKGEFNQTVEEQLRKGIYGMRRVEVELKDRSGAQAQAQLLLSATTQPSAPQPAPVMVWATEIVMDSKGAPIVVEKSPLEDYGIIIQQFSITGTDYDDATKQQFAAKQQSFLKGEQSKAQREAELQQTAMVVQQGLRQKAEIESTENVKKTQQVIQATALSEVAEQTKKQAETVASQALAVAKLTKEAAETKASADAAVLEIAAEQSLKTAELNAKEAEQKAKATIALAEAEKRKIELAGALSEKDRLQMELESKTKVGVAEAISKVNVPSTVINGGGGKDGGMNEYLLNIVLLRNLGIVPTTQPSK